MGQCVSKSGSDGPRGNGRRKTGGSGPEMTMGPDGVEVPVDNRPVLQQQPRRKSIDGASMPPAPQREIVDPRKQPVTVTSSQLEFFKMLDEKIEKGVVPETGDGQEDGGNSDSVDLRTKSSTSEVLDDEMPTAAAESCGAPAAAAAAAAVADVPTSTAEGSPSATAAAADPSESLPTSAAVEAAAAEEATTMADAPTEPLASGDS